MDKRDKKETDGETQFIKKEHQQTRNYVFQKNKITKTAFLIIIVFLIILAIGLAVSGIFFEAPAINP